ncbi:DUF1659 domain-containing protein [Desulfosporosinus sp. OT]|uniref:DUF1659 domain-containing protein n=1 Tax=Desulfosporosinus sp. OT TaxID=913865 RepID=UPI000223A24D|nr:DUF1659 domain-containing protein [Desulfosporosinus sp. OT]EGW41383.1 hypothetical protein DOT_0635 [Desulfosporosinus sp. OT]
MTVAVAPLNSVLVVVYQAGLTALGAPIKRQKSLNYLRFDAAEQAVFDAAHALFNLSQSPVLDVLYRKTFELAEE